MSQFWSARVHELDPYVPGEQPKVANLVKLNTNENPYGPSPKVFEAIANITDENLRLYPDPNADILKETLARYYKIQARQVFVGNGSDEVLAHTFVALLKHSLPLLFPDITYNFYPVYCRMFGVKYETVLLNDNFEIELKDYLRPNGGVIFANPNAPTGRLLDLEKIDSFLRLNRDSVVVVDEAYIDFGGKSAVSLVERYSNLLVIQTLSKSRSLAGLRVGFAIGNETLIDGLERVKNSFNSYPLGQLAIAGAVASIEDQEYFDITCKKIIAIRERLIKELEELGFQVIPSHANFVFAKPPGQDAEYLFAKLRDKFIIVRYFRQPRIDQFLRITVGTENESSVLIAALKDILNK